MDKIQFQEVSKSLSSSFRKKKEELNRVKQESDKMFELLWEHKNSCTHLNEDGTSAMKAKKNESKFNYCLICEGLIKDETI